ncbi:hypothetical protein BGZ49_001031 [Haplosporangium sp. Z 27]|nr:hypothetical protein BGZ49_001031 [Haplosporangium sp. Z 27]
MNIKPLSHNQADYIKGKDFFKINNNSINSNKINSNNSINDKINIILLHNKTSIILSLSTSFPEHDPTQFLLGPDPKRRRGDGGDWSLGDIDGTGSAMELT